MCVSVCVCVAITNFIQYDEKKNKNESEQKKNWEFKLTNEYKHVSYKSNGEWIEFRIGTKFETDAAFNN